MASVGVAADASTVCATAVFSRLGTFIWNRYSRVSPLYVSRVHSGLRAATAAYAASNDPPGPAVETGGGLLTGWPGGGTGVTGEKPVGGGVELPARGSTGCWPLPIRRSLLPGNGWKPPAR